MNRYQSHRKPQISIVFPCFNPPPDWVTGLLTNISVLNRKLPHHVIEYIISNDGSTCLERRNVDLLRFTNNVIFLDNAVNEGKGAAIRKGANCANGSVIIYTDIDFPFGTDPVVEMVKLFAENPECSFLYGSRSREYFRKLPLKRWMFSKGLSLLNRMLLPGNVTDTQAGIKGIRREILHLLAGTTTDTFVFEIELFRNLLLHGVNIGKVEVHANSAIVFTNFSWHILFTEAVNLARIFLGKKRNPKTIVPFRQSEAVLTTTIDPIG